MKFDSTYDKARFILIVVVATLSLAIIFSQINRCTSNREPQYAAIPSGLDQWVVNGKLLAQVQSQALTIQQWRNSQDSLMRETRKHIGRQDKLIAAMQASITAVGGDVVAIRDTVVIRLHPDGTTDTVIARGFAFDDGYLKARATMTADSAAFDYSYTSDVQLLQLWQYQGFLKPPVLKATLVNSNPKAQVTGMHSWVILPPKPKWWQRRGVAFAAGAVLCGAATTALAVTVK